MTNATDRARCPECLQHLYVGELEELLEEVRAAPSMTAVPGERVGKYLTDDLLSRIDRILRARPENTIKPS